MKRAEILDSVKKTITQDRNNRHGEPENSFPLIAERWSAYIAQRFGVMPETVSLWPSDVAEMMALFKDVRFHMQPENPDNKHDQIGYLAIACELRAAEMKATGNTAKKKDLQLSDEERRMFVEFAHKTLPPRMCSPELRKCLVKSTSGTFVPMFEKEFEPLLTNDRLPKDLVDGDVIAQKIHKNAEIYYSVWEKGVLYPLK